MTLNLNLSPEKETALKAKSQARGVSAEQYALLVIDRDLDSPDRPRQHISEVIREIMSDVSPEDFATLPKTALANMTTTFTARRREIIEAGLRRHVLLDRSYDAYGCRP